MEEDQEMKHSCKFCNKSFHSGRSLGGHMRTHLISSVEPDEKGHYAKKLPPLTHQQFKGEKKSIDHFNDFANIGYSLRENPKKTNKFVKSGEDNTLLQNMICKECGKSLQSWKALFDHMKFHSEKVSKNLEEDSLDSSNEKEVTSHQSDDEVSALNRKKRSRRAKKISENLNDFNASSSSPCVSAIDQEPEEAAISLLLLSRDYGIPGNRPNIKLSEGQTINISENCIAKEKNEIKESDKSQKKSNPRNGKSSKRKCIDLHDPKKQGHSEPKIEFSEGFGKRNSFECISCNSFQALGGHKASHIRIKGCFISMIDSSENSTETELFPNQTAECSKVIKYIKEKFEKDHESRTSTKFRECPICFKVFNSGQALGGHKRSHLIADAKNDQISVFQKSSKEERDFLDLNLPPPDEKESNDLVGFQKWWMPNSHKQTLLVGTL